MTPVTKGILGRKIGMSQVFVDESILVPVTVIQTTSCRVTAIRTPEQDGYSAVQLGFEEVEERKLSQPEVGHLAKVGAPPLRTLAEIRLEDSSIFEVGQELKPDIFEAGERVDVMGTSKGKGFAGTMKRHGFHGYPASHGVTGKHRAPGAIGACATPSRVFKGMKMSGHMGNERVTILNLEVVKSDAERNVLLIKGAIPGPDGTTVMVRSSVKSRVAK